MIWKGGKGGNLSSKSSVKISGPRLRRALCCYFEDEESPVQTGFDALCRRLVSPPTARVVTLPERTLNMPQLRTPPFLCNLDKPDIPDLHRTPDGFLSRIQRTVFTRILPNLNLSTGFRVEAVVHPPEIFLRQV